MKRLPSLAFAFFIVFSMTIKNTHSKQSSIGRYSTYNSHNGINRVTSHDSSLTLVGRWPYGACEAVFVKDDYAYIGNGSVMTILDISDPASPKEVGEIVTPGVVNDIFIRGHYAYVANGWGGLRIIDVIEASSPVEKGYYDSGKYTQKVYVFRQTAYIGNDIDIYYSNIDILNVSAPTGPERVRSIKFVGTVSDIDVKIIDSRRCMFVANWSGGLHVYDVTDAEYPVEIDRFESDNPIRTVYIVEDYAYVIGDSYLYIMDVSHPEDIKTISSFYWSHGMQEIHVSDGYAYITDIYFGGVWIMDVRKPDEPNIVTHFVGDITHSVWDVHVKDRHAYIACSSNGLYVLDVSMPEKPKEASSFDTGYFYRNLVVLDDYAYVIGAFDLYVFDVSIPEHPRPLGSVQGDGGYTTDIYASGDYAYFTCRDGLRIVDVSNPDDPSLVGSYNTESVASAIYMNGDYAYLACWDGLRVMDVSNKSNPTEMAFIETENRVIEIDISQEYAYIVVVGPHAGPNLLIFDVSTPMNPVLAHSFSIPDYAIYDVNVSGGLVYVVSMGAGLRILDFGRPDNPVEIGAYDKGFSFARNITVTGNFAYMTDGLNGLRIIDVSKPDMPTEVDGFRTHAYGLYVSGNMAYVTCGDGGFYILRNELADETEYIPSDISLMQNYPNPFNASTAIRFALSVPIRVTLKIFDLKGRTLETLVDDVLYNTGVHEVEWTADNLPSGVYVYRFYIGDHVEAKKMILIR